MGNSVVTRFANEITRLTRRSSTVGETLSVNGIERERKYKRRYFMLCPSRSAVLVNEDVDGYDGETKVTTSPLIHLRPTTCFGKSCTKAYHRCSEKSKKSSENDDVKKDFKRIRQDLFNLFKNKQTCSTASNQVQQTELVCLS
ncbi:hypothetical protein GJ496_002492 [Pomphorhynchus laevis]|nr:hypothetical protein GJ496_002492 [Pomphorhynchus laevis]